MKLGYADTWDDMRYIFADAFSHSERPNNQPEKRKDDAQFYLNTGFRDWIVEDGNTRIVKFQTERLNIDEVARAAREAVKPVRITLAIHPDGDGLLIRKKKRTVIHKPKIHVWFFNDSKDIDEMERNAEKGMPPKLLSKLYGVNQRVAVDMVGDKNKALQKVKRRVNT